MVALFLLIFGLAPLSSSAATTGTVLVYERNAAQIYGSPGPRNSYSAFEEATGRPVEYFHFFGGEGEEPPGELPLQITPEQHPCIILQNDSLFAEREIGVMQRYLQAGGTVIGIGEYYEYLGGGGSGADAWLNWLALNVGAPVAFQGWSGEEGWPGHSEYWNREPGETPPTNVGGPGTNTTHEFGPSPAALEVGSLQYGRADGLRGPSKYVIASGAASLDPSQQVPLVAGGPTVFGGGFFLVGSPEVFSDAAKPGYENADNGALARNLCGKPIAGKPSLGYGYGFPNRILTEDVSPVKPAQILRPEDMARTFVDWVRYPGWRETLGEHPATEPRRGFGQIGALWKILNSGLCYGLALSAGRFNSGVAPLFSLTSGRTDPAWISGGTPQLPDPWESHLLAYDEQFLRMATDDFVSQRSIEAQESIRRQKVAYRDHITGVAALAQQLKSVIGEGKDGYDPTGLLSSSAPPGFALLTMETYPHDPGGKTGGHAVLAFDWRVSPGGTITVRVMDSNKPLGVSDLVVYPDGTWEYEKETWGDGLERQAWDRPVSKTVYTLQGPAGPNPFAHARGRDEASGFLSILPVYEARNLHYFLPQGTGKSTVDVGPGATASGAVADDGSAVERLLTATAGGEGISAEESGTEGGAGESLLFQSPGGSLFLEGDGPSAGVRGSGVYMTAEASGPAGLREDTASGSISIAGAPALLSVAREGIRVHSSGASSLSVSSSGGVSATADGSGQAEIVSETESEGTLHPVTLFSGPTSPGKEIFPSSAAAPKPPPAASRRGRAPVLSAVRLTNRRFRVAGRPAVQGERAPLGTRFRFKLSAAARLQVRLVRPAGGRRGRLRAAGALSSASKPAGTGSLVFAGRIGGRALSPGKYRAILSAGNAYGNSRPRTLRFTIVR